MVAQFGPQMLTPTGELDRPALARLVFSDPAQRAQLEAITHPLIHRCFTQIRATTPADQVLVYEIPLLAEVGDRRDFDHVVVVEAEPQVCVQRLTKRGLTPEQARQRMATQADPQARRLLADTVIDNSGTMEHTRAQVERLWRRLETLNVQAELGQ